MIVGAIYILLLCITVFMIIGITTLVKRSKSLIPIIPILAIYFWSLYGVWEWIPFKQSGKVHYFEEALFTVDLDWYYFQSVLYYSLFLFVFICIELHGSKLRFNDGFSHYDTCFSYIAQLKKSNRYFLIILFCFLFFAFFARQDIATALLTGKTAYEISRGGDNSAGGLYSLFQYSGDMFIILSIPMYVGKLTKYSIATLLMMVVFFILYLVLGNRHILIVGTAIYILLYSELYGLHKLFNKKNIILGIALLLCIESIYFLRTLDVESIGSGKINFEFSDLFQGLTGSSEKYASHISMYGVLAKNVELTYGSSFLFLVSSLIPSFMSFARADNIYEYYISQTVSHREFLQAGFTINHATAWYLNFGLIGICLGAYLWAKILVMLFKKRASFLSLYAAIIFSAVSVQMVRAGGMESYKSALIMNILIPLILMKFSLIKFTWGRK